MSRRSSQKSPTTWLGIAFLLIGVLLAYFMVAFWPRTTIVAPARQAALTALSSPAVDNARTEPAPKKAWNETTHVLGFTFKLDADVRLLILVLLAGSLGSYVHAVQSFASYVGNARFKQSWTWWYILRMPMGAALAMFVYFVVRGGLLASSTATATGAANDLNLFGIMSFSALAGLFSKQAADKLAEVFDTLFATKEDRKREDKLGENPLPVVTSVLPETLSAAETEITLTGHGFVKDSVVKAAGKKVKSTFESAETLKAKLAAADLKDRLEIEISVINPEPGGGESDPVTVKIREAGGDGGGRADQSMMPPIAKEESPAEPAQAPS